MAHSVGARRGKATPNGQIERHPFAVDLSRNTAMMNTALTEEYSHGNRNKMASARKMANVDSER